mmetsp:Transcript_49358/g.96514  ORF Transcript_49358/g.96514 Transcript_49358/m.96514 type:complete len:126 (-) Transcript_49358:144-521(-)
MRSQEEDPRRWNPLLHNGFQKNAVKKTFAWRSPDKCRAHGGDTRCSIDECNKSAKNMVEVDDALSKSARKVFGKEATAQHMGGGMRCSFMGATKVQEALFRWVRQRLIRDNTSQEAEPDTAQPYI